MVAEEKYKVSDRPRNILRAKYNAFTEADIHGTAENLHDGLKPDAHNTDAWKPGKHTSYR